MRGPGEDSPCWLAALTALPALAAAYRRALAEQRGIARAQVRVAREAREEVLAALPERVLRGEGFVELADGTRGQVVLIEVPGAGFDGVGVLWVVRDGPDFAIAVRDLRGRERPEWVPLVLDAGTVREVPGTAWAVRDWPDKVRHLSAEHAPEGRLVAAAGLRFLSA